MESPKFLSLVWRWAQTGSGECWVPFGMGEHPASDCAAHPLSPGVMEMPQELRVFAPTPNSSSSVFPIPSLPRLLAQ